MVRPRLNVRKHGRFRRTMGIRIGKTYGLLKDISAMGMQVVPDRFPDVLSGIDISFRVNEMEIKVKGSLVWVKEKNSPNERITVGIKIDEPSPEFDHFMKGLSWDFD